MSKTIGRVMTTALLAATAAGCFSPRVPSGGMESGTDGGGSTGLAGTIGDASSSGSSSGTPADTTTPAEVSTSSGPSGQPPEILSFTANGEEAFEGLFAQGVDVQLEASDPDGEIVGAEIWVDDTLIAAFDGPQTSFGTEWLISGAAMNGMRSLRAVVVDDEGLVAEAIIPADLDMPNGGFTDVWEDEGGFSYAIATDREGAAVMVGGVEQPLIDEGDAPVAQIDRVDDGAWATPLPNGLDYVADLIVDESGDVWAVATRRVGDSTDTTLVHYNAAGSQLGVFDFDAGQDTPADGPDTPVSMARLSGGDFIIHGSYVPSDGSPGLASYVLRSSPDGDVAWLLRLTESDDTTGEPFANEVAVGRDDVIYIAGARPVGGVSQAWHGAVSADGDLIDQVTIADFYESRAYAAGAANDGRYAFSGAQRDSNTGAWNRWLRLFDESGEMLWSKESTVDASFGHAVTFDDFGNVLSVSTETCEFDLEDFSFGRCGLRIHKYDAQGELVWVAAGLGGDQEFNGPVLFAPGIQADVMVDRYGYIYVSGLHRVPSPIRGDWWAARLNP